MTPPCEHDVQCRYAAPVSKRPVVVDHDEPLVDQQVDSPTDDSFSKAGVRSAYFLQSLIDPAAITKKNVYNQSGNYGVSG